MPPKRHPKCPRCGHVRRLPTGHCAGMYCDCNCARYEGQGSVHDWAARCAKHIADSERNSSVTRLAAVIATFADPLVQLVRDSRREHADGEAALCPRTWFEPGDECTCGADKWNERVDEVLQ